MFGRCIALTYEEEVGQTISIEVDVGVEMGSGELTIELVEAVEGWIRSNYSSDLHQTWVRE